jgi:uncharacterized protein (DUF2384 family)
MAKMIPAKAERMAWEKEDTVIRMDIGAFLAATNKKLDDLAEMMGICRATMYRRYKYPGEMSLDEARRLYQVIGKVLALRAEARAS